MYQVDFAWIYRDIQSKMGSTNSVVTAPAALPAVIPSPQPKEELPVAASFPLGIDSAQDYLQQKVPASFVFGGIVGAARGYYVGNLTGLYGYSTGLGFGMGSTAFYGTVYLLRYSRQKDDTYNYAISGSVNGFWIVTGLTRNFGKGLVGAAIGAVTGTAVKICGDWLYCTSREAWLSHRLHAIEFGKPRLLEARKPMFHPRDSRLPYPGSILPRDNLTPPVVKKEEPAKSKGWLW